MYGPTWRLYFLVLTIKGQHGARACASLSRLRAHLKGMRHVVVLHDQHRQIGFSGASVAGPHHKQNTNSLTIDKFAEETAQGPVQGPLAYSVGGCAVKGCGLGLVRRAVRHCPIGHGVRYKVAAVAGGACSG